ncbi:hypothetical protein ADUPG1_001365, partial [Aduncisulcus paluster]
VDTVGPIMPSKAKSRYLVVMVDCFTRWTEIVPTKRATAKAAADALISGIFGRFGLPRCIRSDRGTQYVNGMISELYKKLGVTPHKVLPYHPQANGIVERTNQEVIRHMRIAAMRIGDNEEWEQLIPLAQYVINTTKNRMTGKTPYEALCGDFRKPARGTLLDWKDEVEEATLTDDVTPGEEMCEYVTMLKKRVTEIQEIMRIAQKEATERRDAKVIRDVDKANDKLDGALTRGLVDVPADANGQLTPEKDYVTQDITKVTWAIFGG